MPRATAEMFLRLQHEPLLQPFVLIGGTALALHLGHRLSEDLDFLCADLRLPRGNLRALVLKLQEDGHSIAERDNVESFFEFQIAGMDLHDYSQTMQIDDAVSVTFFTGDEDHVKVLESVPAERTGPRVASLPELCALKALVARRRSTSRDWLDLYLLERDYGYSLSDWRRTYEKAGLKDHDFENALGRICSGRVRPDDALFDSLLPNPPTIEEIAEHFRARRVEYEIEASRGGLPNSKGAN